MITATPRRQLNSWQRATNTGWSARVLDVLDLFRSEHLRACFFLSLLWPTAPDDSSNWSFLGCLWPHNPRASYFLAAHDPRLFTVPRNWSSGPWICSSWAACGPKILKFVFPKPQVALGSSRQALRSPLLQSYRSCGCRDQYKWTDLSALPRFRELLSSLIKHLSLMFLQRSFIRSLLTALLFFPLTEMSSTCCLNITVPVLTSCRSVIFTHATASKNARQFPNESSHSCLADATKSKLIALSAGF